MGEIVSAKVPFKPSVVLVETDRNYFCDVIDLEYSVTNLGLILINQGSIYNFLSALRS